MVKTIEFSADLRQRAVSLYSTLKSCRKVGECLKMSASTVIRIIHKQQQWGTTANLPRSGRKRATTVHDDRAIVREAKKNRRVSAAAIQATMASTRGIVVSEQTIRNRIHASGFHGCQPRKKPLISRANRLKRLQFARTFIGKPEHFWNSIIWSDESKFNLCGSDGNCRVWRTPSEAFSQRCILPTMKHGGGSIMVWGCMAASGVGNLHIIHGILTGEGYKDILEENLQASRQKLHLGQL
jgi:transposase